MNSEFKSVEDLYKRVLPALRSKKKELERESITYIKEEDIWNYLIESTWKKSNGLELNDIVNDILNVNNDKLKTYVKSQMRKMNRKVNLDKDIL